MNLLCFDSSTFLSFFSAAHRSNMRDFEATDWPNIKDLVKAFQGLIWQDMPHIYIYICVCACGTFSSLSSAPWVHGPIPFKEARGIQKKARGEAADAQQELRKKTQGFLEEKAPTPDQGKEAQRTTHPPKNQLKTACANSFPNLGGFTPRVCRVPLRSS